MNNHRSDYRLYLEGRPNKADNKVLYEHLKSHGANGFEVQIVEKLSQSTDETRQHELLNQREREWIWKLETVAPKCKSGKTVQVHHNM